MRTDRYPWPERLAVMKRRVFADLIIVVCIGFSAAVTAAVVYEYHRLDTVMPAGVVTALLGLWGGELLIIAIRQIFGSDVITKKNNNSDSPSI